MKGLQQVPECGPKTLAVLRAELGDVQRFSRTDEVIACGGMDTQIKESGLGSRPSQTFQTRQWPGSRRVLSMTALRSIHRQDSAFGVYYQRLVERGLKKGSALMAVMRKGGHLFLSTRRGFLALLAQGLTNLMASLPQKPPCKGVRTVRTP